MAEDKIDDNTGVAETDSSSEIEYEPIIDDDGLISTTEFREVKKADSVKAEPSEDAEKNTSDEPESKDKGFHDHPRFKELIQSQRELKEENARLKAEREEKPQPKEPPKSKYKFDNLAAMDDEALSNLIIESPKKFVVNLANQLAHEIKADFEAESAQKEQMTAQEKSQAAQQAAMEKMYSFFREKEDATAMLKDGTIEQFLNENPHHNPISAYLTLVGDKVYQQKLEAEKQNIKQQLLKELKAAGKSSPVSQTAPTKTHDEAERPAKSKAELKAYMLKFAK